MKTLFFSILLSSLWLAQFAFAQQKQNVDMYGYRLEAPSTWEVDKEVTKNTVYVEDKSVESTDAASLIAYYYDSTEVMNEETMKKQLMTCLRENVGEAYRFSDNALWKRIVIKDIENNGIKFKEFSMNSPRDEDKNYVWVCIWVTLNEETKQYIYFVTTSFKEALKPHIDKQSDLEAMLKSIKRFKKTIIFENKEFKQGESIDFTITFLPDDTKIEKESKKELRKIIDFLKNNPNIDVSVVGYASKIQAENRVTLGKARAEKVMQELIEAKISPKRLTAKGSNEDGIDKRVKIVIDQIK
jgi:outer membrane protein OmpA-like peptidoglycan-associated protein